ncbi:hypothetical protein XYCOK13_27700 [Xylanibacillus composti]|uniref:Uncharacterized protein n=1 Tax=Xylanibacillus composti TaxID=1572762 RepID=A0A8J4H5K6_9BACL|nr:hypothetical protein XYCOK13_27700 [Xylanibacillus composti]
MQSKFHIPFLLSFYYIDRSGGETVAFFMQLRGVFLHMIVLWPDDGINPENNVHLHTPLPEGQIDFIAFK